jgi:DNA/RNA endonuclease YhcR with UshA esterase domain
LTHLVIVEKVGSPESPEEPNWNRKRRSPKRAMVRRKVVSVLMAATWLTSFGAADAGTPRLQSYQAKNHFREAVTVCGVVASTKYASSIDRSPTFLDLDRPYPQEPFAIVIFGRDRGKFGAPESTYAGKRVCVTGTIVEYRGRPEIIATDPSQISTE